MVRSPVRNPYGCGGMRWMRRRALILGSAQATSWHTIYSPSSKEEVLESADKIKPIHSSIEEHEI